MFLFNCKCTYLIMVQYLLLIICCGLHRAGDAENSLKLLQNVDINVVTSLLKLFLRELPEALFTDSRYSDFIQALGRYSSCSCCRVTAVVVLLMLLFKVFMRLESILYLLDRQTLQMRTNSAKSSSTSSKDCLPAILPPFLTFFGTS